MQQFSNPLVCTWQLKDKEIDVAISPTEASPSPTVISFLNNTIYAGLDATSPPLAIAEQKLPTSLNNLKVKTISLKNIFSTGVPNQYAGVIEVSFDRDNAAYALKPIQIQQILQTTTSGGITKIDSCASAIGASSTTTGAGAIAGGCSAGAAWGNAISCTYYQCRSNTWSGSDTGVCPTGFTWRGSQSHGIGGVCGADQYGWAANGFCIKN